MSENLKTLDQLLSEVEKGASRRRHSKEVDLVSESSLAIDNLQSMLLESDSDDIERLFSSIAHLV